MKIIMAWMVVGVGLLWSSSSSAGPAPSSPVDWGDTQDNWVSLQLTADQTPYVAYSRFEIGGNPPAIFEARQRQWDGTDWQMNVIETRLLQQPYPELKLTAGPLRAHFVYNRFTGNGTTIRYRSYNPLNFGGIFLIDEDVAIVPTQHPLSVAIRSDGQPAVVYWDGGLNDVYYRRRVGPNVWTNPVAMGCSDGFPTIALSTATPLDKIRVTCVNQNQSQVRYVWEDVGGALQANTVFPRPGDPPNHVFARPTLVLDGGLPRIVAFNQTTGALWYAEKSGAGVNDPWNYKLVDDDPARVAPGLPVASSFVLRGNSPRIQVAYSSVNSHDLWYRQSSSIFGVDVFITDPFLVDGDCGLVSPSVSLAASSDGATVQLGYAMVKLDNGSDSGVKHATWKLPLTQPTSVQLNQTHNVTSMSLDLSGRPVKCFYRDDPLGDIYVEWLNNGVYQADPVAANVGLAPDYARGCDVDVAPDGTMGVVHP